MASPDDELLDEGRFDEAHFDGALFDEALFDEDSPSVGDDLTMAQVTRQLAWVWAGVLLLAVLTAIVARVV